MRREVCTIVVAFVLSACGGGGAGSSAFVPVGAAPISNAPPGTLDLIINAPKSADAARRPAYLSPATTQVTVDIQQSGVSISGYPTTVALTPSSSGCTSTLANTQCQLTATLSAGTYTVSVTAKDASGTSLSAATNVAATVTSGGSTTIPIVMGGIPSAISVTPISTPNTVTSGAITLQMDAPVTLLVEALDADNNIIAGSGAPALSASISNASAGSGIAVAAGASTQANSLVVSSASYGTATLSVTATGSTGNTALATYSITTAAGVSLLAGGHWGTSPVDGTGAAATFVSPLNGLAYDAADGAIYVAETSDNHIRKVTTAGVVTSPVAMTNAPYGIAYDSSDTNLYILDSGCIINKVTTAGSSSVFTGSAGCGSGDGSASTAKIGTGSAGLAYDPNNGDFYLSDAANCSIRQIDASGSVSTIAGGGSTHCAESDGSGTSAYFNKPEGIVYNPSDGNLYVVDASGPTVRKVTTAGIVTTVAGTVGVIGDVDGTGTSAVLNSPSWIAYDSTDGNLYVSEVNSQNIRRVTLAGVVTTVTARSTGQATIGVPGALPMPHGVAYDPTTKALYVGATGANGVYKLQF